MTVNISSFAGAGWQLFNNNGVPLAGGLIYSYVAGTTTAQTTYTSISGSVANSNPIILDSAGRVPNEIWLTAGAAYKFVIKDASGNQLGSYDDISGINDQSAVTAQIAALAASYAAATGSNLIGYLAIGSGAVPSTVQTKLRERISVKDFGATGDGTTDDTAAIQAAVTASAGKALYFPAGTYIVSDIITLMSNTVVYGDQGITTLKLKAKTYAAANVSIFVLTGITNVYLYGLIFNGNKGNVGTARNPINTVYNTTQVTFDTCQWVNCEGICLNVSTSVDSFAVLNCRFINCGGATDNSDGYRNQGIAFSASGSARSKDIEITGNYFYAQGLDCISLCNLDDVVVSNNAAYNSYSFLYNNPSPYRTVNLTVTGNVIYNTNQGSLNNLVNPVAIDLPRVSNASVTGNSIYKCEQSGIGIFDGSVNVVVSGNSLVDCGYKGVSWYGGISVGGGNGTASGIYEVIVSNNIVTSTGTVTQMSYGILVDNDLEAVILSGNTLVNYTVSKYGYYVYTTVPGPGNVFALTSNSQISATTLINDVDPYTQTITNWRKTNTLTGYYFNGTKVVGAQQGAIANSGNATTDAILAALRTHGLIAT
jgi:polygalacturonase